MNDKQIFDEYVDVVTTLELCIAEHNDAHKVRKCWAIVRKRVQNKPTVRKIDAVLIKSFPLQSIKQLRQTLSLAIQQVKKGQP